MAYNGNGYIQPKFWSAEELEEERERSLDLLHLRWQQRVAREKRTVASLPDRQPERVAQRGSTGETIPTTSQSAKVWN